LGIPTDSISSENALDPSTISDENVRALIWSKITPEPDDPTTIRLTLNVPIVVARALTLIATLEERPLKAVALEGLAFYTGLERYHREKKS
jgi:hypothetical protein